MTDCWTWSFVEIISERASLSRRHREEKKELNEQDNSRFFRASKVNACELFGDHGLYQISWTINVIAFLRGHMIGEELQRNNFDNGQ